MGRNADTRLKEMVFGAELTLAQVHGPRVELGLTLRGLKGP